MMPTVMQSHHLSLKLEDASLNVDFAGAPGKCEGWCHSYHIRSSGNGANQSIGKKKFKVFSWCKRHVCEYKFKILHVTAKTHKDHDYDCAKPQPLVSSLFDLHIGEVTSDCLSTIYNTVKRAWQDRMDLIRSCICRSPCCFIHYKRQPWLLNFGWTILLFGSILWPVESIGWLCHFPTSPVRRAHIAKVCLTQIVWLHAGNSNWICWH